MTQNSKKTYFDMARDTKKIYENKIKFLDADYDALEKQITASMVNKSRKDQWQQYQNTIIKAANKIKGFANDIDIATIKEVENFLEFTHGKGKIAEMMKALLDGFNYYKNLSHSNENKIVSLEHEREGLMQELFKFREMDEMSRHKRTMDEMAREKSRWFTSKEEIFKKG